MSEPQILPIDPGNRLLAAGPVDMCTTTVDTPEGQRGAVTLRTTSTTLTALLTKEDLRTWARILNERADEMTGLTIVRGPMPANLNGTPAAP